ncbi:MAG: hypothetical protein HUU34_18040 [Saprospiraceae bacterium]|nr:hypothetical protein [Saprospiraceae bacterium]
MAIPNKTELKSLVAKNKIEEVIKALLAVTEASSDGDLHNDVVTQSAKWQSLKREQILGTIDPADEALTRNRITHALLSLIDQLPDSGQAEGPAVNTPAPKAKPQSPEQPDPIVQPLSPGRYLTISLVALSISVGLFFALTIFQDQLSVQSGNRAYYILLFPLAFSTAAFLFGAMRSYAAYTQIAVNHTLELGGPIVAALLVIVAGFQLVPQAGPFEYTIFLEATGSRIEPAFKGKYPAIVKLKLNNDVRTDEVDEHGAADFKNIPVDFQQLEVPVELDFNGWQFADTHDKKNVVKLAEKSATLAIEPDGSLSKVFGAVRDENDRFLADIAITVGTLTTQTDKLGRFSLDIPIDQQKREQKLRAYKEGYKIWEQNVYPEQNEEIPIMLIKATK